MPPSAPAPFPRMVSHAHAISAHLAIGAWNIHPIPRTPEQYVFDTWTQRWIALPVMQRASSPDSVVVREPA